LTKEVVMLVGTLFNDVAIASGIAFVACLLWVILRADEPAQPRDDATRTDDRHAPRSL
jgi:hypothetical protein